MNLHTFFGVLSVVMAAGVSSAAYAGTGEATMPVSGEVRARCDVAATPMRFQIANPGANVRSDAVATIHLRCTRYTIFTVTIDYGLNANGTQRRMISDDGDFLVYNVYSNAARTRRWGLGRNGLRFRATGAAEGTFNVYGRIPNVSTFNPAGVYRDTLTVNVNF